MRQSLLLLLLGGGLPDLRRAARCQSHNDPVRSALVVPDFLLWPRESQAGRSQPWFHNAFDGGSGAPRTLCRGRGRLGAIESVDELFIPIRGKRDDRGRVVAQHAGIPGTWAPRRRDGRAEKRFVRTMLKHQEKAPSQHLTHTPHSGWVVPLESSPSVTRRTAQAWDNRAHGPDQHTNERERPVRRLQSECLVQGVVQSYSQCATCFWLLAAARSDPSFTQEHPAACWKTAMCVVQSEDPRTICWENVPSNRQLGSASGKVCPSQALQLLGTRFELAGAQQGESRLDPQ